MKAQLYTLQSGSRIDNYQVKRVLGIGGFGITYQAHDMNLDCPVAIKEYFPHGLAVREANGMQVGAKSKKDEHVYEYGLQRFMEEARVLARFKHRSIIRVSRFMEKYGTAYIIMDYEEGVPLSRYLLRCKQLSETEIRNVFRPILKGLDVIHQQDYLHRDIKPANIYLRKQGTPVLLDFGAARQALDHHGRSITNLGTHGYAPIEQFTTQERQGTWSDIYGVGATIYHSIAGYSPVSVLDRIAALQAGRHDPLKPAVRVGKNRYSPDLLESVDWMLNVRSTDRPQTVDQIIGNFNLTGNEDSTILTETDVDWDAELIAQAERHLANYLGPLANLLVKQAMSKTSSVDELYQILARHIDTLAEREQFIRSVQASTSLSDKVERRKNLRELGLSEQKTVITRIDSKLQAKLEEQLASRIGPLATMLVRQAIRNGSDLDDIIEILCEELPTEYEKKRFRKSINV